MGRASRKRGKQRYGTPGPQPYRGGPRASGPGRAWWVAAAGGVVVVLLAGWLGVHARAQARVTPTGIVGTAPGDTAPSFEIRDIQGKMVGLAQGRPTLLYFVASWCSSCAYGETQLRQVYARYGHALRLITVDVDPQQDTPAMVAAFAKDYGGPWPAVLDRHLTLTRLYQVSSLDTSFLINGKGEIVFRGSAPLPAATWEAHIQPLL
jgi:cytochrome oxidase Cu insertion factor (SCO1/SenC/PrrC family)